MEKVSDTQEQKYRYNGGEFKAPALKPCPFCGAEAELKFKGDNYTKSRVAIVKCTNISCQAQMVNGAIWKDSEWLGKISIEAWNKRA